MYGTVVEHGTEGHRGRSYKIGVTKTGHTITMMMRHMQVTSILVEEYLKNEMSKIRAQGYDQFNRHIDCFAQLHNHEHLNEVEREGKDTVSKSTQSPKHMNAEHPKTIRPSGYRTNDK